MLNSCSINNKMKTFTCCRLYFKRCRLAAASKRYTNQFSASILSELSEAWISEHRVTKPVLNSINRSSNSKDILELIESHSETIKDPQIYVKAMAKCKRKKDFDSVHELMLSLIQSGLRLNVWSFSIFIDAMAISDKPQLCWKYFKLMIGQYNIRPNVILFSSLIKSLRFQSKYKKAEKCWKMMTRKYNLKPDAVVYAEMLLIYQKMEDRDKAIDVFNEYLDQVKDGTLRPHFRAFAAYLNVFCQCSDINGMEEAMKYFEEYGLELNAFCVTNVMNAYRNANEPKK